VKECRPCRQEKLSEEFPRRTGSSDGLHSYCRACITDQSRQWRQANSERNRSNESARRARKAREHRETLLAETPNVPERIAREYLATGIRKGPLNASWQGNDIGYAAAHYRVNALHGPASNHSCVECGDEAEQWSYIGGCPNDGGVSLTRTDRTQWPTHLARTSISRCAGPS
jgi:hypothetical protein